MLSHSYKPLWWIVVVLAAVIVMLFIYNHETAVEIHDEAQEIDREWISDLIEQKTASIVVSRVCPVAS